MDGGFGMLPGVALGRLAGFAPDGAPLIEGEALPARALVTLGPGDVGAEVAWTRLPDGAPLLLGRLRAPLVVAADGEAEVIEATRELRLTCGRASLTLHRDGRVEVRGTAILSRSTGPNRVQGASVHLN